ncbi:MAG TPA: hypothetical protein VNE63_17175 [Candidatus Acidoferrales bacterium]|nr:hypothetical protein [Candidatus Acidoferrales bacterium]
MKWMEGILANRFSRAPGRAVHAQLAWAFLLATCVFLSSGCNYRLALVDTSPLDAAGMSYDSIQKVKAFKITAPEVAELAKVRQSGLSDEGCVEILQIFRARGKAFNAGDTVAGLMRAGVSGSTVLELAKLNQLDLGSGELLAMRLASLSDDIILEVARHHAEGKTVLSGASLAEMKNTGLRNSTLLELARRGIGDSETSAILASRGRGANDAEILRRFQGS